jgi:Protein of unknown function (DUF3618)
VSQTPAQIEAEIEAQRAQLADTVDALAAKLDVTSRAKAKVGDLKDRATTETGSPRPELIAAVAVTVAVIVGLAVWRRR